MDINVRGTWFITRCAMRAVIKRLVYGSSDAVYSPFCHSSNPIYEDAPKRPHFLYPLTKNLNESIVFEAWRESNYEFEVTATRFGSVMAQDEFLTCLGAKGINTILHSHETYPATVLCRDEIARP